MLGHPAVAVFVSHVGVNSLYEAAYHAKPIVSIPLIADQPANAAKAGALHSMHALIYEHSVHNVWTIFSSLSCYTVPSM